MTAYVPPPRSLLYVSPVTAEQGGGLEIGCDCGRITHLMIKSEDILQLSRDAQEVPFTCDGCLSTHWFTIGPLTEMEEGKPR